MVFEKACDLMKSDWWENMSDEELKPPMSEEQLKVMNAYAGKGGVGVQPQLIAALAGSGKITMTDPPYRMHDKGDIMSVEMREKMKRLMEDGSGKITKPNPQYRMHDKVLDGDEYLYLDPQYIDRSDIMSVEMREKMKRLMEDLEED
jgi:hypothetical protein